MNTGGLAVDISLLAVLIALHVTKKNKNLELVVMALLFSHIIMTTEAFLMRSPEEGVDKEVDKDVEEDVEEEVEEEVAEDVEVENPSVVENLGVSNVQNAKSVSDGGFDRAFQNIPAEVNLDLAKARSSFFEELFPNK